MASIEVTADELATKSENWKEGYDTWFRNQTVDTIKVNPHPVFSEEYNDWQAGYSRAAELNQ